MNEMALPSRHMSRNSRSGDLRRSTLSVTEAPPKIQEYSCIQILSV